MFKKKKGERMTYNLQSGRNFEDIVEGLLKFMGYNTIVNANKIHIHAEITHAKGKNRLLIECKNHTEKTVSLHEVEKFCHTVALAREHHEADLGMLISNTSFSEEAMSWCTRNCSFVQLRTYGQLISASARFRKLARKFHKWS